jgi:hypothetical protein
MDAENILGISNSSAEEGVGRILWSQAKASGSMGQTYENILSTFSSAITMLSTQIMSQLTSAASGNHSDGSLNNQTPIPIKQGSDGFRDRNSNNSAVLGCVFPFPSQTTTKFDS